MDNDDGVARIIVALIVIAILIVMVRFVVFGINLDVQYTTVCKWEFGENWTYEYVEPFGRTCVELDYKTLSKTDRSSFPLSNPEIRDKYCHKPSFWDLKNWDVGCSKEETN